MGRKNERPTLAPAFSVERFARESDRRLRATDPVPAPWDGGQGDDARGTPPPPEEDAFALEEGEAAQAQDALAWNAPAAASDPLDAQIKTSETRIATRPRFGAVLTNESWARLQAGAPVLNVTPERLKRLPLDHRAGFVLSLMDGATDLETLVLLCAFGRDAVIALVRDLYESGVIRFV